MNGTFASMGIVKKASSHLIWFVCSTLPNNSKDESVSENDKQLRNFYPSLTAFLSAWGVEARLRCIATSSGEGVSFFDAYRYRVNTSEP